MKIDFGQKFDGLDSDEAEKITLASVVYSCLNFVNPNTRESLPLDEAVRRGNLALRLKKGGAQEVDVDEISLIRSTLSTMLFKPFIIAQAAAMVNVPKD